MTSEPRSRSAAKFARAFSYTSGAYGFVQSSNYNARNRAAEVLVDGASFSVVRRRETIADQLRAEVASSAAEEVPQAGAPLQYRV